jgi:hypothetical protein
MNVKQFNALILAHKQQMAKRKIIKTRLAKIEAAEHRKTCDSCRMMWELQKQFEAEHDAAVQADKAISSAKHRVVQG